jgi:hypothetical protein
MSAMDKKKKIGIIRAGRIGKMHAENIRANFFNDPSLATNISIPMVTRVPGSERVIFATTC